MRIKIDKAADAVYFRLDETAVLESEQVQSDVILDYDASGRVVGVEILGLSKRVTPKELSVVQVETV